MKCFPFTILLVLGALLSAQTTPCFGQDETTSTATRKVVNKVMPMYPQMARSLKLSGAVKLEVQVQPNGSVRAVQVKGGNPVLVQSAQSAVRGWKWEKADHDSTELVEIHFNP